MDAAPIGQDSRTARGVYQGEAATVNNASSPNAWVDLAEPFSYNRTTDLPLTRPVCAALRRDRQMGVVPTPIMVGWRWGGVEL